MEPSQANYNENMASSTPVVNGSQRDDFTHHPSVGTQTDFVKSGFQDYSDRKSNFAVPPQQPVNTGFTQNQSDTNESYCGRLFRNRRQISSVSGGLHIGWGIWSSGYSGLWSWRLSAILLIFMKMAWSVGAFVGVFVGAVLTSKLRKDSIYYLSGAGMMVGNLLFIIWDADGEAIIAGRMLLGLAHGIAYVALITHAGENAAKNMRGTVLSIVNCLLYTGVFASVAITATVKFDWYYGRPETISAERVVAIVGVVLAVAAIGCSVTGTVESVPFLLRRNSRQHAMTNLKLIRGADHETLAFAQEMEEFNLMNVQDKQDNWNIFSNGNGKPLVVMILMRLMVALTNNFFINRLAMTFVSLMFSASQFVPLAVVAPRLGMSIIHIFYADILKRRAQLVASPSLAAISLILSGILANTGQAYSYDQLLSVNVALGFLWLFFQFPCSIGMDQMQDVYLSEAFSTAKKRWSLAFVAGVEHLFHIFMIGMYFVGIVSTAHLNAIIFVTAVVVLLLGISLVVALPETQNMSLKQAKDSFFNRSMNFTSPFA